MDVESLLVHGDAGLDDDRSVAPPLHLSTIYRAATAQEFSAQATAVRPRRFYARYGNPTLSRCERIISELEQAESALMFSSGMGAISTGMRVLVDRLGPRGLSKQRAAVDLWIRDCAPSDKLRRWFAHDPNRWDGFKAKYVKELGAKTDVLRVLRRHAKHGQVTLLFAARDIEYNNAVVFKEYLERGGSR